MSASQKAAFKGANGGATSFDEAAMSFLIQGVAVTLVFTWFAWVCSSIYNAWGAEKVNGIDAGGKVLHALFLFLVTVVIVSF